MNDKAVPWVSVLDPVTPATEQKAGRLVRERHAGYLKTMGSNIIVMVLGDSGTVYLVSLRWQGGTLYGSCPCLSHGLCSHVIAAAMEAYKQCLEVFGRKQ
jgi:uncharacterized Zn finger protein